jgi:hypothetical protein
MIEMNRMAMIIKRITEDEHFLRQAKDKHNQTKNAKNPR